MTKKNEAWKDLKIGDRVELVSTNDPWTDLAPGTRGVMVADAPQAPTEGVRIGGPMGELDSYTILGIAWDSGSWLMLIPESGDEVKKVDDDRVCPECSAVGGTWTPGAEGKWTCENQHKYEQKQVKRKTAGEMKVAHYLHANQYRSIEKWMEDSDYTKKHGQWYDDNGALVDPTEQLLIAIEAAESAKSS